MRRAVLTHVVRILHPSIHPFCVALPTNKGDRVVRSAELFLLIVVFSCLFFDFAVGGGGGGVMPGSEYSYTSHHYSQYAPSPYGSYGYSAGTGGLLTK